MREQAVATVTQSSGGGTCPRRRSKSSRRVEHAALRGGIAAGDVVVRVGSARTLGGEAVACGGRGGDEGGVEIAAATLDPDLALVVTRARSGGALPHRALPGPARRDDRPARIREAGVDGLGTFAALGGELTTAVALRRARHTVEVGAARQCPDDRSRSGLRTAFIGSRGSASSDDDHSEQSDGGSH